MTAALEEHSDYIAGEVLASDLHVGSGDGSDFGDTLELDQGSVQIALRKI